MVEKVTAAGDEVKPANTGTQEKPTQQQPQQGGSGSPSMAGPLDHLAIGGSSMADPDGHCRVCGHECEGRLCPHCFEDPQSWNAKLDDFQKRAKAAGWNDAQIRRGGEAFFGDVKSEAAQFGQDSPSFDPVKCAGYADTFIRNPPDWLAAVH